MGRFYGSLSFENFKIFTNIIYIWRSRTLLFCDILTILFVEAPTENWIARLSGVILKLKRSDDSAKLLVGWQTLETLIRLMQKQSDLGKNCLPRYLFPIFWTATVNSSRIHIYADILINLVWCSILKAFKSET